tara:strand:+ start:94 stop:537 length:444 start_codon:yes stop_codon:yes gene_type:complete
MSKTLSYKGILEIGNQQRIRLKTIKGKVGYKITKFQLMSSTAGAQNSTVIGQIFSTDQTGSISSTINFSNSNLLACVFANFSNKADSPTYETIIFDNQKFNQDIFINITDPDGGTQPCNYYIELETMDLSEVETTMLTLQSLRTISE